MTEMLRWPVGIDPDEDRRLAEWGLGHWTCVDPEQGWWYVRIDMRRVQLKPGDDIPNTLRHYDISRPIRFDRAVSGG